MRICKNLAEVRQAQKDGAVKIFFGESETVAYFIGDTVLEPVITPATMAQTVTISIEQFAKTLRDKIVADVSPAEMASWPVKTSEAALFRAGKADECKLLALEAATRGITLEALVVKVETNAIGLEGLEAVIAGNSGKHRDAVNTLLLSGATTEEIAQYDYSAGWPV